MRRGLRQLPNVLTSLRLVLILPIALALTHREPIPTLWLFGAAALTDGLDGYLAKRFGWQTELGGVLDPVADKLLLATVFVLLALRGSVPVWMTVAVIARDCIIVLGAVAHRVWLGPVVARPSALSKFNTLCQMTYIIVVVGAPRFSWPHVWAVWLGALVFVTVFVSGIDYVLVYGRQAAREARSGRPVAGARGPYSL
jgi:cardiolipin synthase